MAETLGSLCDKLTIVKLKQWHADDKGKLASLDAQERQLTGEIDEYVAAAVAGAIPADRLTFKANKVYRREGNEVPEIFGSIGEVFSRLADVNCKLWHEQELVYEFDKVAADKKDKVIKQVALLNLERNNCIDQINQAFQQYILSRSGAKRT